MRETSVSRKRFANNCIFPALPLLHSCLFTRGSLVAPSLSRGAELKPDPLVYSGMRTSTPPIGR